MWLLKRRPLESIDVKLSITPLWGGNLELSRGISKGVCACLGGGTLTRLALDPDGAEGLSLQPGRVHTPPSHDLRSKGRKKKKNQSPSSSISGKFYI